MSARRIAFVLCLLFASASARAQAPSSEDRAHARFLDGRAAYEAQDYARAYVDWQESYELSQRPELLYNVGLALQKLGRTQRALEAFESYLAWGKGEREDEVRGRVAALRDIAAQQSKEPTPDLAPATIAAAAPMAEPKPAAPAPAPRVEHRSRKGWWIAAGVLLAAAAIAVGVAVPLSQRDSKPENVPEPNTGLTINALQWAR